MGERVGSLKMVISGTRAISPILPRDVMLEELQRFEPEIAARLAAVWAAGETSASSSSTVSTWPRRERSR